MKSVSKKTPTPAGWFGIAAFAGFLVAGCDGSNVMITSAEREISTISDDAVATDIDPTVNTLPATDSARTLLTDRAAIGPIRVMAVGDSITHGVRGSVSYRRDLTSLLASHSCAFEMVGSQQTSKAVKSEVTCEDTGVIGDGWGWNGTESCLVDDVQSEGEVFVGAHEGYGSHRADHFLTGYTNSSGDNPGIGASMASFTPEVVLLHLGSVDVSNGETAANTLQDIEDIIATIHATQPETLVLLANVIPWFRPVPAEANADIELLGDLIEQWILDAKNSMVRLVDVRSGYLESMMINDQVHPNELGETHIAEAFMSVLEPLVNCGLDTTDTVPQ